MKQFLTVFLIVCAIGVSIAQTTSSVTFSVNMGPAAAAGKLDVDLGNAYLSGSMNGWSNNSIPMARTNSTTDTVYTVTLTDMIVDSVYEYKFLAGSGWELLDGNDDIHRLYKVKANAGDNILPVAYFSNDSTYPKFSVKPIKVSFKCNMDLDIAKGAFDPSTDVVSIRAGFNGWSENITTLKKPLSGTIFSLDTTFKMIPQANDFEYVYTYGHNGSVTWESANSKVEITEDEYAAGEDIELRYFDNGDTKSSITGFTCYFSTDVNNAVADIGGVPTPFPNGVKNIAVVGGEFPLIWPGIGWPDSDADRFPYMNDNGTDGDLVAGDGIWTLKVDFLKGSHLKIPYKYGINYGLPDDNAGSNDNEIFRPDGDANHWVYIPKEATEVRLNDVWGTVDTTIIVTDIENANNNVVNSYKLEQNYPNPFNPSTTISYSIPEEGLVTLKVYNLLGQEVASLVNEVKTASQYKVSFDASNLSSGLYIYRINAKNYTASKKMMLLK